MPCTARYVDEQGRLETLSIKTPNMTLDKGVLALCDCCMHTETMCFDVHATYGRAGALGDPAQ
jgi:hypothetical protein